MFMNNKSNCPGSNNTDFETVNETPANSNYELNIYMQQ